MSDARDVACALTGHKIIGVRINDPSEELEFEYICACELEYDSRDVALEWD